MGCRETRRASSPVATNADSAFETPIQPGTSAVTITLSVQFEPESRPGLAGSGDDSAGSAELVVLDDGRGMTLVRAGRT